MRDPKDIKIGNYTLEEILERHKHWLNRDCENWESMQADLHNADLHSADMSYADLHSANMKGADMRGANMRGADLRSTDMSYVNMRGADISGANMMGANMCGADISGANMMGADLHDANMSYANMRGANMSYANLHGVYMPNADMSFTDMIRTDLRNANMSCVNMRDVNMCGADISGADRLRKGIKLSEPIIGWKKCKNNVLVKLEIPRGAIVFSINNRKCRTDKAKVLEIIGADRAYSNYKFFSYYVGDVIEVFNFNCEYNFECAEGIHFFRTRKEAENY